LLLLLMSHLRQAVALLPHRIGPGRPPPENGVRVIAVV
jgi:hypothetical protein